MNWIFIKCKTSYKNYVNIILNNYLFHGLKYTGTIYLLFILLNISL